MVFPKRSTLRFGKVVAVPFGFACAFGDENNLFTVVLGLVIVGYGVKPFVRKAFVAPMISSHLYGLRNYVQIRHPNL